jgi:hypothetical protein
MEQDGYGSVRNTEKMTERDLEKATAIKLKDDE